MPLKGMLLSKLKIELKRTEREVIWKYNYVVLTDKTPRSNKFYHSMLLNVHLVDVKQ